MVVALVMGATASAFAEAMSPRQSALVQKFEASYKSQKNYSNKSSIAANVARVELLTELIATDLSPYDRARYHITRAECANNVIVGSRNEWDSAHLNASVAAKMDFLHTAENQSLLKQSIADFEKAFGIIMDKSTALNFANNPPIAETITQARVAYARALFEQAAYVTQARPDYIRVFRASDALRNLDNFGSVVSNLDLLKLRAAAVLCAGSSVDAVSVLNFYRKQYKVEKLKEEGTLPNDLFDRSGDLLLAEAYALRVAGRGEKTPRFHEAKVRFFANSGGNSTGQFESMPQNPRIQTQLRYAAYFLFEGVVIGYTRKPTLADFATNESLLKAAELSDPQHLMPKRLIAQQYLMTNRVADAVKYASAALALVPDDAASLTIRGLCALKEKEWSKAEADLTAAIEAYPELAHLCSAFAARAEVYTQLGKEAEAKADINASKAFDALRFQIRK